VVFGADTGVCIRGHVILRHDVIADHWITVSLSFICRDPVALKFCFKTCVAMKFGMMVMMMVHSLVLLQFWFYISVTMIMFHSHYKSISHQSQLFKVA